MTGSTDEAALQIASWNVNSLKVRLPQVEDWLAAHPVDVIGLQETKLRDEHFPVDAIRAAGYHALYAGQPTYNGVALLSREPGRDAVVGLPGMEDPQQRVLAATYGDVRVINLYVPNGKAVGSEKYDYKLTWLAHLRRWLKQELATHRHVAVVGDFNIAPADADVYDPARWAGKILCSDAERAALTALLELGLVDTFRLFDQAVASYSWWDYRGAAFRRNLGLRIDLILASPALAGRCVASGIDRSARAAARPSDHAPVVARFGP